MKKTFIAFLLLAATLITANAQSLTGKMWGTYLSDDEETALILSFYDDIIDDGMYKCIAAIGLDQKMEEDDMTIIFHFALPIPGGYSIENNRLFCVLAHDAAELNVEYEIDGVDESTKPLLEAMLKPEIEKMKPEMKQNLSASLPEIWAMDIVSLTDDTLILVNEKGQKMTFYAAE